jgi:hypothetical protein
MVSSARDTHADAYDLWMALGGTVFDRLRRDNKGASLVTYVLILPLFILLIFGVQQVWKVMSVRQSLSLGVYQAVRGLSSEGGRWLPRSAADWELSATGLAQQVISDELERNGVVPDDYVLSTQVMIDPAARGPWMTRSGWLFSVRAELMVPDLVALPLLDFGSVTLADRQVSYIEGLSGDWHPPREGAPY